MKAPAPAPEATSRNSVSTGEIDEALEAFRNAHPGVEVEKRQRQWSVTFNANLRPVGTAISQPWDFPSPLPAEGSAEYNAYAEGMKTATMEIANAVKATVPESDRHYTIIGDFFDYCAEGECITVTSNKALAFHPAAKTLTDAETHALYVAAKDQARAENKLQANPMEKNRQRVEKMLADMRQANPGAEEEHRIVRW